MSEKMKLLITEIKETTWNDKTYYNCKTASGLELTTTDAEVKKHLNVEFEYDVNSKPDKNGVTRHYINFPKAGGFQKNFSGGKSYGPDPIITAKNTIIMQLIEIVKVYQKAIDTPEKAINFVKDNMDTLWASYGYKVPESKPESTTAPSTGHPLAPIPHQLSGPKQTIIRFKMKNMNWRAKDLIDYAGACGIEIGYHPETDSALIGSLTEAMGEKLINVLQDAAR